MQAGSSKGLIKHLAKVDLLVPDDWGFKKLTRVQRNDSLEIMKDRHGYTSTLDATFDKS